MIVRTGGMMRITSVNNSFRSKFPLQMSHKNNHPNMGQYRTDVWTDAC